LQTTRARQTQVTVPDGVVVQTVVVVTGAGGTYTVVGGAGAVVGTGAGVAGRGVVGAVGAVGVAGRGVVGVATLAPLGARTVVAGDRDVELRAAGFGAGAVGLAG